MELFKRALVVRDTYDDERTLGQLFYEGKKIGETMEPGDKDPFRLRAGFYFCTPHGWEEGSPRRFKRTWALIGDDVSHDPEPGIGHSAVLFHSGVRDEHTMGCILVATRRGISKDEPAILDAVQGETMDRLRRAVGGARQFFLTIKDGNR